MQAWWTLARRELGGHFTSWTGYVVIAVVVFLLGLCFVQLLHALNQEPMTATLTETFFNTLYFWVIVLMTAPVITMRTFAMEKSTGTFETLMTAPVGDVQVVLAKFAGSLAFYTLMWLPLAGSFLVLRRYTSVEASLDPNAMGATFLGIFLVGMLFMSLGVFASALTRSQMVAAMTTLALGLSLFLLSFLGLALPEQPGWASAVLAHINSLDHMRDFSRGTVDTRHITYYASLTFTFLYLTVKVVESRRWK
jgi:ABC-2 type transport system permease protein